MIDDYLNFTKKRSESEVSAFSMLLYELVLETQPEEIFEIGVNKRGISTHIFLAALQHVEKLTGKVGRLTSLDVKDWHKVISDDNPLKKYWLFVLMDSNKYHRVGDIAPIDILHIDGGHRYHEVKADFDNYYRFVKPGGLILFHDTLYDDGRQGVSQFWNEIRGDFKDSFEFPWQLGMGLIRKPL